MVSYLGGQGAESANDCVIDGEGNLLILGQTTSTTFEFDANKSFLSGNGEEDLLLIKILISDQSTEIIFAFTIGGSLQDEGNGLIVDTENNIYITGYSSSYDFPKENPIWETQDSQVNGVIIGITLTGSRFISSNFGGNRIDSIVSMCYHNNSLYLVGFTESWVNFPLKDPFQDENQGNWDIFFCQLEIK